MHKTLKGQKAELTRGIKRVMSYLDDVEDQIRNQHPQPNGDIYLHGEVVARKGEDGVIRRSISTIECMRDKVRWIQQRKNLDL